MVLPVTTPSVMSSRGAVADGKHRPVAQEEALGKAIRIEHGPLWQFLWILWTRV